MISQINPYDELPYKCLPIEWTAPERLSLAARLHGGPGPPLDGYRVLELGCGDGANLLPMAFYRQSGTFVGVDGAGSQIEIASDRKARLELGNVEFIHAGFEDVAGQVSGPFDYVIAHGVFSWIPEHVRDILFQMVADNVRPGGLFYLNYNCRPGWNIRGLVRKFLLAQTKEIVGLRARSDRAVILSNWFAQALQRHEHPYSQLLSQEFAFVAQNHPSFVGHEYLAAHNHPYWRQEFLSLAGRFGLDYASDADFNYASGRTDETVLSELSHEALLEGTIDDAADLLCYRQLHSPIFTTGAACSESMDTAEFSGLFVASCLAPASMSEDGNPVLVHPSGYEVEAKTDDVFRAFVELHSKWPEELRIGEVFPNVCSVQEDLRLLHRNGLIELRLSESCHSRLDRVRLNSLEREWGGYKTSPFHVREEI